MKIVFGFLTCKRFVFVDEEVLNSLEKLGSAVNTINVKLEQSAKPQGPSAAELALAQQLSAQQQAAQAQQV